MKNAKRIINVVFIREYSGYCRQIFKDLNSNKYYCRIEKETVWRSVAPPDFEPDCPVNANFNICDLQGNIITNDSLYPFMDKFIKIECQDIIDNNQKHESWRQYVLKDKETYGYRGYDDNWVYYETNKIETKEIRTLNYLGKKIVICEESYEHIISKKRWTSFVARFEGSVMALLGYSFEKDIYPKALCDFPTIEESEKCTNEKCFYFRNDRCTFLDSDTQIMLSGNDELM